MTTTPDLHLPSTAEEDALTGHAYAAAATDGRPTYSGGDRQTLGQRIAVAVVVAVPLIAVALAVPFAWGWGLGWSDVLLAVLFYAVAAHGITVGFHRAFTHRSFTPSS